MGLLRQYHIIVFNLCVKASLMDSQKFLLFHEGAEDISIKVLQMIRHEHIKVN